MSEQDDFERTEIVTRVHYASVSLYRFNEVIDTERQLCLSTVTPPQTIRLHVVSDLNERLPGSLTD